MWCQLVAVTRPPYVIVARIQAVPNLWSWVFLSGRDSGKKSSFSVSIRLILAVFKIFKEKSQNRHIVEVFTKHIGINNTMLDKVSYRISG